MSEMLIDIASLANREKLFNPIAKAQGFSELGDIDRFIFNVYAPAVKSIAAASRLNGMFFVLEPSAVAERIGSSVVMRPLVEDVRQTGRNHIKSLRVDLSGGLEVSYTCTAEDRKSMESARWPLSVAQQFSLRKDKCVVWAQGVGVVVFLRGQIYLQSADVIEELAVGMPSGFQSFSWDDGEIAFEFARHELNDTSQNGIWHIPVKAILVPKPETLIRSKFGEFLRFRLAGYHDHSEEAHVEHEGRADITVYLIDGRIMIVEIKWIGTSLVATRVGAADTDVIQALEDGSSGWFTKFGDDACVSGIKQVASYFESGKYDRGYLAVFDCSHGVSTSQSRVLPIKKEHLGSVSAGDIRGLRACVDVRTASKRAKV